jgi:hypothetical protein
MPVLPTIRLTKERQIAPYVKVHQDEQSRAVALFSQHFVEKRILHHRFHNGTAIPGLTFPFIITN